MPFVTYHDPAPSCGQTTQPAPTPPIPSLCAAGVIAPALVAAAWAPSSTTAPASSALSSEVSAAFSAPAAIASVTFGLAAAADTLAAADADEGPIARVAEKGVADKDPDDKGLAGIAVGALALSPVPIAWNLASATKRRGGEGKRARRASAETSGEKKRKVSSCVSVARELVILEARRRRGCSPTAAARHQGSPNEGGGGKLGGQNPGVHPNVSRILPINSRILSPRFIFNKPPEFESNNRGNPPEFEFKMWGTPGISTPNFFRPPVWTYPDGARQLRASAATRPKIGSAQDYILLSSDLPPCLVCVPYLLGGV